MMPDNMQKRLDWAIGIITQDAEPDQIGTAAHLILAEFEKLKRGEFICRKCGIRKDGEHDHKADF